MKDALVRGRKTSFQTELAAHSTRRAHRYLLNWMPETDSMQFKEKVSLGKQETHE